MVFFWIDPRTRHFNVILSYILRKKQQMEGQQGCPKGSPFGLHLACLFSICSIINTKTQRQKKRKRPLPGPFSLFRVIFNNHEQRLTKTSRKAKRGPQALFLAHDRAFTHETRKRARKGAPAPFRSFSYCFVWPHARRIRTLFRKRKAAAAAFLFRNTTSATMRIVI